MGLEMTAQPLLQLGTVVLDPAPDGRVIRCQAARAEPLGLGWSPCEDRRSNGLLHHLFRLPAAAGQSCNTTHEDRPESRIVGVYDPTERPSAGS